MPATAMSLLLHVCDRVRERLPGVLSTINLCGDTLVVAFSYAYWWRTNRKRRYSELHIDRCAKRFLFINAQSSHSLHHFSDAA
jgi:hypothetical protein